MTLILGHPSLDFPVLPGGLRPVGGEMGGGFPAPVPGPSTSYNGETTLFINCIDSGGTSLPMNMFIAGGFPQTFGTVDLTVFNSDEASAGFMDLFIKGAGSTPGYTPGDEDLNLYLERGPNAGITLFLNNTDFGNSVPLYITGAGFASTYITPPVVTTPSSLFGPYQFNVMLFNVQSTSDMTGGITPSPTLFIDGGGGIEDASVTLIIDGANPVTTDDQVTLVIPEVVGQPFKTASLYVNGFNYNASII